jgi:hypothetical protein
MKERILTGWTINRALYLIMGISIIVQAATSQQWFGVALGGYFASMGLFAFGCASGNCFNVSAATQPQRQSVAIQDVEFEEVKTK